MDLLDELRVLLARLEHERVEYALCGGLAMAVYAFPRSTLDIDMMIDRRDLEKIKSIAGEIGFSVDAGLMEFKEGRVLIYRVSKAEKGGEPLTLDLLLVTEENEGVWNSRTRVSWEQGTLSVVSPEGLIELKSLRGTGQDREDIERLRSILDEG